VKRRFLKTCTAPTTKDWTVRVERVIGMERKGNVDMAKTTAVNVTRKKKQPQKIIYQVF
jgi:hypothetical protein